MLNRQENPSVTKYHHYVTIQPVTFIKFENVLRCDR